MTASGQSPADYLEPWRAELQILATSQMGPRLKQKVGPEDVVQDTIIKALVAWPAFRGNADNVEELGGWLRKILINEVR